VPRWRPVVAVLAAAVTVAPSASAHGGGIIKAALDGLRSGDPLYIDASAIPTLEPTEAAALRQRLASAGGDVYIAILPADAQHELASADAVLEAIVGGIGRDATYAVVVGGQLRASSTELEPGRAAELARLAAEKTGNEGLAATLTAFVDGVAEESDAGGSGLSRTAVAALIPVLAGLALLATLVRARRRSSVG
jgi:hypothetical protein